MAAFCALAPTTHARCSAWGPARRFEFGSRLPADQHIQPWPMMPPPVALIFLLKGLAVGLSTAAPVEPIGLLCIRRSLAQGRMAGFAPGLSDASADPVFRAT